MIAWSNDSKKKKLLNISYINLDPLSRLPLTMPWRKFKNPQQTLMNIKAITSTFLYESQKSQIAEFTCMAVLMLKGDLLLCVCLPKRRKIVLCFYPLRSLLSEEWCVPLIKFSLNVFLITGKLQVIYLITIKSTEAIKGQLGKVNSLSLKNRMSSLPKNNYPDS